VLFRSKDRTWYGAYIALIGAIITIVLNVLLIPVMGYMGSAIAVLVCYCVMMILNYFWGQKYYFIPYDLKRIAAYFGVVIFIYAISFVFAAIFPTIKFIINTLMMAGFLYFVYVMEKSELLIILKKNKG
jgi:O-antigen/teichoic acid export membrane protein